MLMIRVKLMLETLQTLLHTHPNHQDEPFQSIGSKYVQRIGGRGQKLVKKFGYFIPLIKLLHKLVKIPQLEHFILNDHVSHNEFMQAVWDRSYIKSYNLMLQGEIFFQFVIFI